MPIRLIIHDIRSCHNVGSLLRTADGIGVEHVYFSGYTPFPLSSTDERLPHIRAKLTAQIHKTALGAENSVSWTQHDDIQELLSELRTQGYELVGLEQAPDAIPLPTFKSSGKVALLLGREVEGIAAELLPLMDTLVEIPMQGAKESFNVVQAAAMALYHIRYVTPLIL